jgi:hypothetical protein
VSSYHTQERPRTARKETKQTDAKAQTKNTAVATAATEGREKHQANAEIDCTGMKACAGLLAVTLLAALEARK